ncbi:hypothetical protein BsWGS_19871 [Bradybaena similaris]
MSKSVPAFYGVKRGRVPGVYTTWPECENQVKGFQKPVYKKFSSFEAALEFAAPNASATSEPAEREYNSFASQLPTAAPATSTTSHSHAAAKSAAAPTCNTCCQCSQHAASIASLSSNVDSLNTQMKYITTIVEKLSQRFLEVESKASGLERAFMAPGSKRAFSTHAGNTANGTSDKRPKFDTDAETFTGRKFSDSEGTHVFTDGGCFDNGRNGARAGIGVFWAWNDLDNVSERLPGRPTNNRAEIHAAVRAVQIAKKKGIQNLILHTDSQFLINGITKWIRGWKKNQWKKTTGSPVINQKDFEELDRELQGMNVKWVYVRGHSGDPSNEEADLLARQGAAKLESSSTDT